MGSSPEQAGVWCSSTDAISVGGGAVDLDVSDALLDPLELLLELRGERVGLVGLDGDDVAAHLGPERAQRSRDRLKL